MISALVYRIAVIRERDRSRQRELRKRRELFPFPPHRDRRHGMDVHEAVQGHRAFAWMKRMTDSSSIGRVRIGHAADGGESARGRGGAAGQDCLLVLKPRLPEVHVHVDEARRDDLAFQIDHLGAGAPRGFAKLSMTPSTTWMSIGPSWPDTGSISVPPFRSMMHRGMFLFCGEQIEDGHTDGDAVEHLLQDHRVFAVGDVGGELDVAVDRAGMHDRDRASGFLQPLRG